MKIEATATPGIEWNAYVARAEGATLAHASEWLQVCREAYGLDGAGLIARAGDGRVVGVLPLVRTPRLRGGHELVSMPYLDTGGVLADAPEIEHALVSAALARAREQGAKAIELRPISPMRSVAAGAFAERVDLHLALAGDEETQWRALPATVRNQCRKAERSGLALLAGDSDPIAAFYEPFCTNMRDLGSPVHAERFFRAMARAFGDRMRTIVTTDGARSIGGLVALDFAGVVTVPWASTLRSERARCPNNQIYWEAIRWAIARGARELDFGRSPVGSGTHRFKRGWGALERPLAWLRLDLDGRPEPPSSPKESPLLRRLSTLWERLPVPFTRWLGPHLRRRISS